ncbi:MAG: radical SAM protein [Anaerolineae bacterium]
MTWHEIEAIDDLLEQETGTVRKDWGGRLPIALVFPNTYYLGMSSLAMHSLYRLWNARDDVVCERVFAGLGASARPGSEPGAVLSLESASPLDYFPILAVTLTYEMDYFNLVALLRAANIPARAADRDEVHPLIVAGGPAITANPEPLAPLLDAVVIGEVEPVFQQLTDALAMVADGREAALEALSGVPGVYLPQHQAPAAGSPVARLWLLDLDCEPTHSVILTPNTEFAAMGLIEIARGCGRGCRFCLAGYGYRPPRERSATSILAQARTLLAHTERLGLVSAAVSDHSQIDELAVELRRLGARLSVSSLRVDPLSLPLLRALAESGTRTLTIAPEAGSERLRRAINPTVTEDDVLRAVEQAAAHGFGQIKLYFMLGLPTEEQKDIEALVALARECAARFPGQTTVNVTPFVPKAGTPFQRVAQTPARVVKRRLGYVDKELRRQGVAVKGESPAWAEIQGTLARADHRVAEALLAVERLTPSSWKEALREAGLSPAELLGARPGDGPLPWDVVASGVRASYLAREVRRAGEGRTTRPCPPGDCAACGVC